MIAHKFAQYSNALARTDLLPTRLGGLFIEDLPLHLVPEGDGQSPYLVVLPGAGVDVGGIRAGEGLRRFNRAHSVHFRLWLERVLR